MTSGFGFGMGATPERYVAKHANSPANMVRLRLHSW